MDRLRRAAVVLGVTIVVTGLTWAPVESADTPAAPQAPAHDLPPSVESPQPFANDVAQAVQTQAPGTTVGLDVVDRTGATPALELGADRQFHAASVVKLLIAVDAVHGGAAQREDQREQLYRMLATSDDTIANTLWDSNGGPAIVSRTAAELGLTRTQPPEIPGQWGDTLITARDIVTTYRYLTDRLPEPGRSLVLDALTNASRQAADGWDQYFGIPSGLPGLPRAIKQGWMSNGDEVVLHTTGLVGAHSRYVVVLLTSAPPDASWSAATHAVTAGTAALSSRCG
jgi:hypothetical protein